MMWQRMALSALVLTAAAGVFAADPPKPDPAKGHDRLDAMAVRLGLSDSQKEEIRKIHADFDPKLADAEHQIWTMRHEEHEAIAKVLTDDQRAKVPVLLKAAQDKELAKVVSELGLTDDQKKKLQPVLEEHEKAFLEVAAKGENGREGFRKQRQEFRTAIAKELTDDQRAKLPGVLREEYRQWRDPATRRDHLKGLADQLGLDDKQREQIKAVHAEFDKKDEEPTAQLKQLREQEHAAVDKVLTDDQRKKVQELRTQREAGQKKPG
jgi:Spy/CpxP family protein refolding chaperone